MEEAMKHVEIWYAEDTSAQYLLRPLSARRFRCVCILDAKDEYVLDKEHLEALFRAFNVVEGNELPARLGIRSMSVGDVVLWDGQAWMCLGTGWDNLSAQQAELGSALGRAGWLFRDGTS
jgi:hypothetical protein